MISLAEILLFIGVEFFFLLTIAVYQ